MVYLDDLDELIECDTPGCQIRHTAALFAPCHPGSAAFVTVQRGTGAAVLACAVCQKPYFTLALGRKPTVGMVQPNPDLATVN